MGACALHTMKKTRIQLCYVGSAGHGGPWNLSTAPRGSGAAEEEPRMAGDGGWGHASGPVPCSRLPFTRLLEVSAKLE